MPGLISQQTQESERGSVSQGSDADQLTIVLPSARAVAVEILIHGPRSRKELAEKLGLSQGSLTRLTKPLLEANVLVETDAVRKLGRGRSQLPLDVVPSNFAFAGIKLTSDTLYAVLTDLRANIIREISYPIRSNDPPTIADMIVGVVSEFESGGQDLEAVGITVGGYVANGEVVTDSPFLHWHNVPFRSIVASRVERRVSFDNDVIGLTKAQHWFGTGKGHADFAMLTIGAGVGYGLVIHDEIVRPKREDLGTLVHYPIDPSGPVCELGHRGCAIAYLSSDAIRSAISVGHKTPVGYAEGLDLAAVGEPVATRVVNDAARALGRLVSAVAAMTGVDHIILSGEGIRLAEVGAAAMREGIEQYREPSASPLKPSVTPMTFNEWSRGAAVLAIQDHFMALQ
jgi:predicted NBD/HSP70 family sugar kinase